MKVSTWIALLYVIIVGASADAQEDKYVKALWVVRDAMKTKASIDQVIGTAVEAGLTDVYIQVRGRGDAYYQSAFVPKAAGISDSFDPLDYFLKAVRPHRIRVHLWLNVFLIWSADENPSSSGHIYNVFPEWSAVSGNSVSMAEAGTKKIRRMNHEGVFFSPSVEDYQTHFMRVVEELMMNYKADGIHLDYIRYPGNEYDYSIAARSRFMLSYHTDPLAINRELKDSLSVQRYSRVQFLWDQFRRDEITRFVRMIRDSMRIINPAVRLSAAVFADLETARNRIFQDWPVWLENDIIDFAVVMNYATDDQTFRKRIGAMNSRLGREMFLEKVVQGISLYNQGASGVSGKLKICDDVGVRKRSFFSYESVRSKKTYLTMIRAVK